MKIIKKGVVKPTGNTAHVIVPSRYLGQEVIVGLEEEYVYFEAQKGEAEVSGFLDIEEADTEDAIQFYDQQQLNHSRYFPRNMYKQNTPEWCDFEELRYNVLSDDEFISCLYEFKDVRNKVVERDGYTLIINNY